MSDPIGPVVINSREIYDQLVRVGALVERAIDKLEDATSDIRDHENRLRALEKGRWPLPSLAMLTSVATLILTIFHH